MKFFSRKNNTEMPANDLAQEKGSISSRLSNALKRTRSGLEDIFAGKREINAEFLEELESSLIMADIGAQMTHEITQALTQSLDRNELKDIDSVKQALRTFLISSLKANVAGKNISNSEIEKSVMKNKIVDKWVEGKTIKKIIIVPKKIINIVSQ